MKKYCIFYKCKNKNAVNHAVTLFGRRRRYFTFDEAAAFIKQRENGANGYSYWITTTSGVPVEAPTLEDLAASGVNNR